MIQIIKQMKVGLETGVAMGGLVSVAGVHQEGVHLSAFTDAIFFTLSLTRWGIWLTPSEAKKIVYMKGDPEPKVVRVRWAKIPIFWYQNQRCVIFAQKDHAKDVVLHEMGHWYWQHHLTPWKLNLAPWKQICELQANQWAIAHGADAALLANGFQSYFRPMPRFLRGLICEALLGKKPNDYEMFNVAFEPPEGWIDMWTKAATKGL